MRKKTKIKKLNYLINLIVLIICFVSSIYILIVNENKNYNLLFIFPICFCVIYFTYFSKVFIQRVTPFNVIFCLMIFIRYVIMSVLVASTGYSCGAKINFDSFTYLKAQIIMILELIIVNIVLILKKNKKDKEIQGMKINNNADIVIIAFSLIVIGFVILLRGNILRAIYFIIPNENSSVVFNSLSDFEQMILMLFNISKQFLFVLGVKKCYIKYKKDTKIIYFIFALLLAIINILIYTSVNRANFIMGAFSSIYLLIMLFEKYKKSLIIIAATIVIVIIPFISEFRNAQNLLAEEMSLHELSIEANAYLAGIDNVACSIETANSFKEHRTFSHFIYDMTRGILGINLIMKSFTVKSSSILFNYMIFGNWKNTSQIIPIIGQGFFYFDVFGFWIIETIFLVIALHLEKIYLKTSDIYLKYFTLLILLRLSMLQGLSGTILGNAISFDYIAPCVIIWLNNKIVLSKEDKNDYY